MSESFTIRDLYLCKQDFIATQKDSFDRVIPEMQAYYLHQPVVSEYLYKKGFTPNYPNNKKFAVCVSHDVDRLFEKPWSYKTLLNQQARALLRFNLAVLKDNPKNRKRRIYPKHHLDNTLALGDSYGVKSTFYFLSLMQGEQDFNYTNVEISNLHSILKQLGHEIGLHGGHEAYKNLAKLQAEKEGLEKVLRQEIQGYRGHYLKLDVDQTWQNLTELKFLYDTTYGFAQTIGFRNGMCYPFWAHTKSEQKLELAVLPLQIMDETLFSYMKLSIKEAYQKCTDLFDQVIALNGIVTLLWHNNYMHGERGAFYESLLKYLYQKNGWFTTGTELIKHYKVSGYLDEMEEIMQSVK